ncbi:MAG TPA: hybrid sensor histidine kinase/response regulator [Candidatus Micrarchaeaceae archaeon]|nr:hybrid sensor histidine kinase/response regulator [Candidatus Micrarchaeaceae archaeon]
MVVDDEPANLLLLDTLLKSLDYSVTTMQDPVEALELAETSPPDLVLVDLQMPGVGGLEICRRLKAAPTTRLVPVLVVTAMDSREHRLAALDMGADDFLAKPVDRVELIARVRSLLRLKSVIDQLEDASLAKNEFLANMSHEMRTPLSSILGFTDLLLTSSQVLADQERVRRYLQNIHTSGKHLMALIADVLDLTKIEARRVDLNFTEVDLNELLASVHEMMRPIAASKGVEVRFQPSGPLWVSGDATRLRQIILNLTMNGVKFTPSGGLVSITAASAAEYVEVSVADTGVGIGTGDQNRVFEPFIQLRAVAGSDQGGAGLGLALVKQLTELHGGQVGVESELGRGTTVHIRLPSTHVEAHEN